MKQNTNKIYVPKLFKKANVKKLILILYCVVPLLVVSIGFASWLIVGADSSSTASGTFYASDIINSYDYIVPVSFSAGENNTIKFYPTAFVDSNGEFQTSTTIKVEFTLHLGECKKLLKNNSSSTDKNTSKDTLTAFFNLSFSSGTTFDSEFFKNLTPVVTITPKNDTASTENKTLTLEEKENKPVSNNFNDSVTIWINDITELTNTDTQALGKQIEMKISDLADNLGDATLTITYTLSPKYGDYQTIYEKMTAGDYKLMMDVTINDYSGSNTTN